MDNGIGANRQIGIILLFSLAVIGFYFSYVNSQASPYDDLIRLHVIANSDSIDDQSVKLEVRDKVLSYLNPYLDKATSKKDAEMIIKNNMGELNSIANEVLVQEGYSYVACTTLEKDIFPTKKYGNFVVPAGQYQALRIKLGDAEGKNWWCVLFPPLCFVDINKTIAVVETEEVDVNDEDVTAVFGEVTKVKYKSKLLEWIK